MGQWGTSPSDEKQRPNWFKDTTTVAHGELGLNNGVRANNIIYTRPHYPPEAELIEATNRGWERVLIYTDSAGKTREKREVVVADGQLATTLDKPEIVDIRWTTSQNSGLVAASTKLGVVVTFNQPVEITTLGSNEPTFTVTKSDAADPVLEYVSGNKTNKLTFVDDDFAAGGAGTASIEANKFSMNSSTIVAYNPSENFSAGSNDTSRPINNAHNAPDGSGDLSDSGLKVFAS